MTVEEMTIDDAINVVNVIAECETPDAMLIQRELALAARRLVRQVREQAAGLERERAPAGPGGQGGEPSSFRFFQSVGIS